MNNSIKHNGFSSLRTRSLLAFLVVIIPMCVILIYMNFTERAQRIEDAVEKSQIILDLFVEDQNNVIEATRQLLFVMSKAPEVLDPNRLEECHDFMASVLFGNTTYTGAGLFDLEGNLLCSSLDFEPGTVNLSDTTWFKETVRRQEFSAGSYQIGPVSGRAVVVFALPIFDDAGELSNFIVLGLDLNWLNLLAADVEIPENSVFMEIDRDGTILARHPDSPTWVGENIKGTALGDTILEKARGELTVPGVDGITRTYYFAPVGAEWDSGVYAAIGIDEKALMSSLNQKLYLSLLGVFAVGLLVLWAAQNVLSNLVLDPITRLVKVFRRLEEGDYSARIDVPDQRGEINQLGMIFNQTADALEKNIQAINEKDQRIYKQSLHRQVSAHVNRAMFRLRNVNQLFEEACRIVVEEGRFKFSWATVFSLDQTAPKVVSWGMNGGFLDEFFLPSLSGGAIDSTLMRVQSGKKVICQSLEKDVLDLRLREALQERGFKSFILLPLFSNGIVVGLWGIYAGEEASFTDDETLLYDELAEDLSFAIESARSEEARRRAEDQLKTSEERQDFILNLVPVVLYTASMDKEPELFWASERVRDITGYTLRDFVETQALWESRIHPQDRAMVLQTIKTLPQKKELTMEYRWQHADGTYRWFLDQCVLIKDEAKKSSLRAGTWMDITEKKGIEDQVGALNELKTSFVNAIAHQMRTPMNSIRWNLESILGGQLGAVDEAQKQFIGVTYEATVNVIEHIHDLLTLIDMEENRLVLEKQRVELCSLLRSTFGRYEKKCSSKSMNCRLEMPADAEAWVEGDATKLRAVFEKILDNAVGYNVDGKEISLHVRVDGQRMRFEVQDEGIGIPEKEQGRIFERFYRASNASSKQPDATGIGLFIAKFYTELHGGKIGFESHEGQGSRFWVEFPLIS